MPNLNLLEPQTSDACYHLATTFTSLAICVPSTALKNKLHFVTPAAVLNDSLFLKIVLKRNVDVKISHLFMFSCGNYYRKNTLFLVLRLL